MAGGAALPGGMAGVSPVPAWCRRPCQRLGAHLTWVMEDLHSGEEAGCVGKLLQGTVHTGQLWWVCQDGTQALTGLTAGACGQRGSSARCPWVHLLLQAGTTWGHRWCPWQCL